MAQRRQLLVRERAQVAAEDTHLADEVAVEAAEQVEQRGLAAAALTFDGEELAARHRQIELDQEIERGDPRLARRIALADPGEADGRLAHGATSSMSRVAPSESE